jgi:hypothetical protein
VKSAIYFYRPYQGFGSGLSPVVSCGGEAIGLGAGRFHKFTVDPGLIRCSVRSEVATSLDIDAQAGQTYYIRIFLSVGSFDARVHLEQKDIVEVEAEVQKCREQ